MDQSLQKPMPQATEKYGVCPVRAIAGAVFGGACAVVKVTRTSSKGWLAACLLLTKWLSRRCTRLWGGPRGGLARCSTRRSPGACGGRSPPPDGAGRLGPAGAKLKVLRQPVFELLDAGVLHAADGRHTSGTVLHVACAVARFASAGQRVSVRRPAPESGCAFVCGKPQPMPWPTALLGPVRGRSQPYRLPPLQTAGTALAAAQGGCRMSVWRWCGRRWPAGGDFIDLVLQ